MTQVKHLLEFHPSQDDCDFRFPVFKKEEKGTKVIDCDFKFQVSRREGREVAQKRWMDVQSTNKNTKTEKQRPPSKKTNTSTLCFIYIF